MAAGWPDHGKYTEAIQNPSRCFLDGELKHCSVVRNALGLPKPSSGRFGVAFELRGTRRIAVKCFTQPIKDQQQRYSEIAKHLAGAQLSTFVDFLFIDQGIRVDGNWFPIVKMEWAGGELLPRFVESHLKTPHSLRQLAEEWRIAVEALRSYGIAHGDFQNGNIKVHGGKIQLIDYDGVFVPSLVGKPPGEIGDRHFQHPARSRTDFGPELDNFSAIVIYVSLLALSAQPNLWQECYMGENLIFTQQDFQLPGSSAVWSRLRSSSDQEVRRLANALDGYCRTPPMNVPSLESMICALSQVGGTPNVATSTSQRHSTPWYRQAIPSVSTPWYREPQQSSSLPQIVPPKKTRAQPASTALIEMPQLVGKSNSQAGAMLKAIGLDHSVVFTDSSSSLPKGTVTSQSPTAATRVPVGSLIKYWISTGASESSRAKKVLIGISFGALKPILDREKP
jgi:hypothetical protein